ncbi:MAG: hypothetical protein R6V83_02175 [Candidatus Thorarchaeota archaeon]
MSESQRCKWLDRIKNGYACKIRKQVLPLAEVTSKCSKAKLAKLCVGAYKALTEAEEAGQKKSTDTFPWLLQAARNFQQLDEKDNAILAFRRGVNLAAEMGLVARGYDLFRQARELFESGVDASDEDIEQIKKRLAEAGWKLIESAERVSERDVQADLQAELKASIMGGLSLKTVEREEEEHFVVVDRRELYAKKSEEYREGAQKYLESGIDHNAILFACMASVADLMMGNAKRGLDYLKEFAKSEGLKQKLRNNVCFKWVKLLFKGAIEHDIEALDQARTVFLQVPFAFKNDSEFGRRVMDSIYRKVNEESEVSK